MSNASHAINLETVQSLRELQAPGEPDLVEELFSLYFRDAPPRIAELSRMIAAQDAAGAARVAHSLKSASANLGCEPMADYCGTLESLGRNGSLTGAAAIQVKIQLEYQRIVREIAPHLPSAARTGT